MRMPLGLIIQDQKLTEYLLTYQEKNDKSQYLALAGYSHRNWRTLKRDILNAVEGAEIIEVTPTDWGSRFKVQSRWNGPNGQLIKVISRP